MGPDVQSVGELYVNAVATTTARSSSATTMAGTSLEFDPTFNAWLSPTPKKTQNS